MGKTDKRNLREDETLAEAVKNTNLCMMKVFLDTEHCMHANSLEVFCIHFIKEIKPYIGTLLLSHAL